MALQIASTFVQVLTIYAAIGLFFAILFVSIGAGKIDSNAKNGTIGFRLLLIPGSVALWPLLLMRWLKGTGEPPAEMNAHDRVAQSHAKREAAQ